MAEEPENLILRLLQDMRQRFDRIDQRLTAMDDRFDAINERLTDLTQRIDGNTVVFNLVAGVVHDHEQRITDLEVKP